MADCYQKLGDAEAHRIYQQLARDYADQKEAAATARARLGQAAPVARTVGDRVVWAGDDVFGAGGVSPDGRYMTDIDYNWTGNLILHDLVTGKDRALTGNKDWSVGNAASSTFSPDGKQVAYGWRTYSPRTVNDLRIISLDGTGVPQPRRLITSDEVSYYEPTDWSRDGRWLAVTIELKDLTKQIALISVADSAVRVLKTVGWRGPGRIFFSSDSKYVAYSLPVNDDDGQRDVFVMTVDGGREVPLIQNPANDVVMGWSPDGRHLIFGSDRTGSMGLWAVPVKDGRATASALLLKPNTGLVSPVGIAASGALYVVRDASTVGLHVAPIDLDAGKLTGPPVLQSFRSEYPGWSPDGQYLAYAFTGSSNSIAPPVSGRLLAIRSTASGEVRDLRPSLDYFRRPVWMPDLKSLLVNGRDFKGRFGLFRIDAQTGATSVISSGQTAAQVQVSPDGKKLYYGITSPAGIVEHDLESGSIKEIFHPRPNSFGGEIELSPNGRLLAITSSDNVTKTTKLLVASVAGGEPRELYEVSAAERTRLTPTSWTPDGRAVLVLKRGERNEKPELWLIPVYEGAPRKLDIDVSGWGLGNGLRLHPNGRQIAFFTGTPSREAWVYERVAAEVKP
jgi:Tol biopolymer transport system component